MRWPNREIAAAHLARSLARFRGRRPLVLGIPRGAVPMARVVAEALGGDLDVVLVRKIGAPGSPEFAIGAVDEEGRIALNEPASALEIEPGWIERAAAAEMRTLRARRDLLAPVRSAPDPAGRVVIVVDDGIATGSTMSAALSVLRRRRPDLLVAATAVAAPDALRRIAEAADEVVCLHAPADFRAVGQYFDDFGQVTDDDVVATLRDFRRRHAAPAAATSGGVRIAADGVVLDGDLAVPRGAHGLVVFAHGSGSSRKSPRNALVAARLQRRGFATLLLDLLTPDEDLDRRSRFDIDLLTERLAAATSWARSRPDLRDLPVGLFGASTGAACALRVAADRPDRVASVVSRGGRPDLAAADLSRVRAPTLLLVGGADEDVLGLNRAALALLRCEARLEIVPGATHLFEEEGALEAVADLAADWFEAHLPHGAESALAGAT